MTAHSVLDTIHVRGLTKRFGDGESAVIALRGIDLNAEAGEILMLVGPPGCGKTTLISVLAGIMDKTAGTLSVFGVDPTAIKSTERARWRGKYVGFVFQTFNLIPALTATENTAIPLLIHGVPRNKAMCQAADILTRVGLGDRLNHVPSQLSGGQQQRVAIARALVHAPRLVVCDEPTSALDHETGNMVMELLHNMARELGCALMVVTHDVRILQFADRIARVDDGRIVGVDRGETRLPSFIRR